MPEQASTATHMHMHMLHAPCTRHAHAIPHHATRLAPYQDMYWHQYMSEHYTILYFYTY